MKKQTRDFDFIGISGLTTAITKKKKTPPKNQITKKPKQKKKTQYFSPSTIMPEK